MDDPLSDNVAREDEALDSSLDSAHDVANRLARLVLQNGKPDLPYDQLPIARLPDDILGAIFRLEAKHNRPDSKRPRTDACWMRLAQICRRWRGVLLDMPALWAKDILAFGVKHGAFDEILRRAQGAPLTLDFKTIEPLTLARALPLVPRADALHFDVKSRLGLNVVLCALPAHSLRLLRTFSILVIITARGEIRENIVDLFEAVNLRNLDMNGVFMHPPENGNLVRLKICLREASMRPTLNALLAILACHPGLQVLELIDAFYGHSTERPTTRVVLPELRVFFGSFVETNSWSVLLLDHLRMPNVQSFKLQSHSHGLAVSEDTQQLSDLLQAGLSASAGSPALPSSDYMLVIDHERHWLRIFVVNNSVQWCFERSCTYYDGRLALAAGAVVSRLSSAHVLDHARFVTFTVFRANEHAAQYWKTMLPLCAKAEELSVLLAFEDAVSMLEFLRDGPNASAVMPLLRKMTVTCHHPSGNEVEEEALKGMVERFRSTLEVELKFRTVASEVDSSAPQLSWSVL